MGTKVGVESGYIAFMNLWPETSCKQPSVKNLTLIPTNVTDAASKA